MVAFFENYFLFLKIKNIKNIFDKYLFFREKNIIFFYFLTIERTKKKGIREELFFIFSFFYSHFFLYVVSHPRWNKVKPFVFLFVLSYWNLYFIFVFFLNIIFFWNWIMESFLNSIIQMGSRWFFNSIKCFLFLNFSRLDVKKIRER